MKLKARLLVTALCMVVVGCVNHDIPMTSPSDSFVFGRYFGYCAGDCYDVFVLTGSSLYHSEEEGYPTQGTPWTLPRLSSLNNDQKNIATELRSLVPQSLLGKKENVIGCVDCSDFGAVYIELNQNGAKRFWYIDNMTQDPELKNFVITVHKKIDLIVK